MKRLPLAALLAAFFIFLALSVSIRQAVLMGVGVGMGAALAAARFGFTTGWRQLIEQRNPQGVSGQMLLLALASLAALPLLGQFPELHAALGPPSVSLLVGAFVFGLTMQIADGCGSGSLYKAGLGVPLNMGICRCSPWAVFWVRCTWTAGCHWAKRTRSASPPAWARAALWP